MVSERNVSDIVKNRIVESAKTNIIYHYFDGVLKINDSRYDVGQLSFSEVAHGVLDTLKELYGEYKTIPYALNSEAYENNRFKAEVLALGGLGLLEFTVYKKQVVE